MLQFLGNGYSSFLTQFHENAAARRYLGPRYSVICISLRESFTFGGGQRGLRWVSATSENPLPTQR